MNPTLLLMGGVGALCFILYSGFRIVQRRSGSTVLHIALAFATIALLFAASVQSHLTIDARRTDMAALAAAGILVGIGIVAALLERRRGVRLSQASGLMMSGAGVLLGVLILVTPMTVSRINLQMQSLANVTDVTESIVTATPTEPPLLAFPTTPPDFRLVETSGQPDDRRSFAFTPLPTRYVPTTPTATPEPEQVSLCAGTVQNNLNLRAGAGTDYERLTTIPYATTLEIYARSADGSWLWVGYGEQSGWVSAQYVTLNGECGELPQRDS